METGRDRRSHRSLSNRFVISATAISTMPAAPATTEIRMPRCVPARAVWRHARWPPAGKANSGTRMPRSMSRLRQRWQLSSACRPALGSRPKGNATCRPVKGRSNGSPCAPTSRLSGACEILESNSAKNETLAFGLVREQGKLPLRHSFHSVSQLTEQVVSLRSLQKLRVRD